MIYPLLHDRANTEAAGDARPGVSRRLYNAIVRWHSDQVEIKRQALEKRRMLHAYQQEMLDGMPLHERLKAGNYRF